ncbi:sensor histidine kinase [Microvirga thermotolerans]|uniref:Blue-light-activated histidine kinase n=1 Tax=Microvirga thermotolerans TaxID=2651334 RepID=A0A5P9JTN2_9HYPH|nr:HWE histidine kinase domain-containing protein [Microvirga thermotolerans]QFU16172.1 PAS domain-containing protein [Microvirga thermotolerans]
MTLTRRLLLLALISVLPAIAIWTYTEVSLRRAREAEISDLVLRQARLAGSELERVLDGIQSLLIAVDETPAVRRFEAEACNAYLRSLQKKVPHLLAFVVLDLEGVVRCRNAAAPAAETFGHRVYFQDALATRRFVAGQYTPDFSEGGIEMRPVLPFALPIVAEDGRTVGVLATALDLNWLDQNLKLRALPPDGSLTVADSGGTIVAREPLHDSYIGKRISYDVLAQASRSDAESLRTVTEDGIRRIIGHATVQVPPRVMYVAVGLPWKEAFEGINRAAQRGFMLIGAALVLALSLSALTSRAFVTTSFAAMTDGVRAWRQGNYRARINPRGAPRELRILAEAFNDLMDDVTERQHALQASEEQARLALEAGRMGTWWYNHATGLGGLSAQAAGLLGLPAEKRSITVSEFRSLVHPDDSERVLDRMRAAVTTDGSYEDEYRIRTPGGETRWLSAKGRVFFDPQNRPVTFVGVFHDITDRKRAESQQKLLLGELNHRVKNTLATVQSIASQTLRTSPDLSNFKDAFEGRLMALSKTHDLLTRSSWREARLRDIVDQELAPYRRSGDERVSILGPPVTLSPRYAINFGLVLHELVTNAVKYGALSSPSGRIEIRWSVSKGETGRSLLRMHWQELDGPPARPPRRQGFGSRLIRRSIEGEMAGTVSVAFPPTGVVYDLTIPLE